MASPRIFALSDIHVDYPQNMIWIEGLSATDYLHDVLILGGDVTCRLHRLREALMCLRAKFRHVVFVPGNHEVWLYKDDFPDSMAKFRQVLKLCRTLGVETEPVRAGGTNNSDGVWIVPLFSWYCKPQEGSDSLFVAKQGENPMFDAWADDYFTKWNGLKGTSVADAFLQMNCKTLLMKFDAPVISFSHFLPRSDLIFYSMEEIKGTALKTGEVIIDGNPLFNFSRVAGCSGLEKQIRKLGSKIHVYGHQHRNRERRLDGVRYISHCLGYPSERESGQVWNLKQGPRLIWPFAFSDEERL